MIFALDAMSAQSSRATQVLGKASRQPPDHAMSRKPKDGY